MKLHPEMLKLTRLAAGLSPETRQYLAHAVTCRACRERLARALSAAETPRRPDVLPWPQPRPPGIRPSDLDRLLDGFTDELLERRSALAHAEAEASTRVAKLLAESPGQRAQLLSNEPCFWTWQVADLLVEAVRETSFRDPAKAESLAGLVLGLAGLGGPLPEPPYRGRRGDLLARTWASLANARRLRSDLAGAGKAFAAAHACLRRGTRDALERAHVVDLEASLAADQRRFPDALRLLERAATVFAEYGESHHAGRSRVKMATVHSRAGEPERAIPLLYEALSLVEAGREPRLDLSIRHNLMTALADAGQALEARRLFRESRGLYRRFPEPWAENRRLWLSGKIARGLGQLPEAEAAFKAARDGFLGAVGADGADGIPYDTALVTLELAALYAKEGRTAELARLAAETAPIFLSRQIHREALVALAFFRQAVESSVATTETITRVASYLKRAQDDPGLAFEPA
jgi:tetratricopeptide (TPR) repeat protein